MQTLLQDLRYSVRMLLKNVSFTAIAIMTLALGIGANTAIFSVVNSVLLRPLPYKDPERLFMLWERPKGVMQGRNAPSPANFIDWRDRNHVFEGAAAMISQGFNLTGTGEPERLQGQRVSANLFQLLGVEPALGRAFLPEDDRAESQPVVILGYGLWQRRFGADPNIIGKTVALDSRTFTVVGVMPEFYNRRIALWVPTAFSPAEATKRHDHYISVIARLKANVSPQQAQAEIETIASRLEQEYPQTNVNQTVFLSPLRNEVVGNIESGLLILFGAVGFVLLIACANVANLLLARAAARQRELAIRMALGAGRWRIIRQLLTESLLLAALGGIAGLLLGYWGIEVLIKFIPESLARAREASLDGQVLGFVAGLSFLTGVVFGLAPAWQFSKPALNETLKEGGRGASSGNHRLRSLLVVSEVALALVLLIGAGLLIKSFLRLQQVNLGFEPRNLLTMQLTLPPAKYTAREQRINFYDHVLERINALPGVQAASVVTFLPLTSGSGSQGFTIEGRPAPPSDQLPWARYRMVGPDYFRTLGIPLLKGRSFNAEDTAASPPVLVISQTMAQRLWPGENPLGKRIKMGYADSKEPWVSVVGVVGDARHVDLVNVVEPFMYATYQQMASLTFLPPQDLVLRTAGDPLSLAAAVRREVWAVDRDLPVSRVQTMEQILSQQVSVPRFNMLLLGLFAVLAVTLAGVGIYGVMSYSVTQATHEIGVRMALGAQRKDVLKLVLGHGLMLTLLGVIIGILTAFALTRTLGTLLYGVSATDWTTFLGIPVLLTIIALLACYLPARRATKVDPMVALRYE